MSAKEDLGMHQLIQQAQEAEEEYQKLLYTVSHDLAAPIRSIIAFAKLLEESIEEKLTDKEKHYLSFVLSNGEKVQQMFLGLLEHSRLITRAGEHVQVDANQVVANVLNEMQALVKASNANIQVDKLPNIKGEPTQLARLFNVLIDNSIKYRQHSTPLEIHISADRYGKGWRFLVKDNGIGMEPKYAEEVFNVFRRLHTDREYPGVGMGLALAKRIMERHKGDIWVKSVPGKGSSFYFFFPNISELESV